MPLRPIDQSTLADAIIEQVIDLVVTGEMKPGDRLPPERELAEKFRVGRSSIREAMKALTAMGVLERTRYGTVVNTKGSGWISGPMQVGLLLSETDVRDVFEARQLMEVGLASLAAQRVTPADIEEIRAAVHTGIRDVEEFRKRDIAFHTAVVKATGNQVIIKLYETIQGILFKTHRYYAALDRLDREGTVKLIRELQAQHEAIAEAIANRDPEGARAAMEAHFENLSSQLLSQMKPAAD